MRDTVAELAERAQLISQEAGTKVGAAMKDVISAAAGLAGFAIESARDLTQYMVRRGQMTQEEADKLIRQAEDAHSRRPASERSRATATKLAAERAAAAKAEAAARALQVNSHPVKAKPAARTAADAKAGMRGTRSSPKAAAKTRARSAGAKRAAPAKKPVRKKR